MPQCQFMFSAVFGFEKSYTGKILGIGRDKNQRAYFYRHTIEVQEKDKVKHQGDLTHPRRGLGLARAWGRCGPPGRPPTSPLRLFILRHEKNS